jgi:regulator of protease activity HflC (stomatin/prohibitin superfamily)
LVRLNETRLAAQRLGQSLGKFGLWSVAGLVTLVLFWGSCTAEVSPNEWGVEQVRFGTKTGIGDEAFGPGVYFVGPGTTMHSFPREIHLLEASMEREMAAKRGRAGSRESVRDYYEQRDRLLGNATHRTIEPLNIQTSDGYAVSTDVSLLYSIANPIQIAKEFGWGSLYIDGFVINTFRNGVLSTLGKMSAEDFYHAERRVKALAEAEELLRQRFAERGFKVERLLIRNYVYIDTYERSLQEKKVAVQLTEKNKKESVVNEERAKLQQIDSKGNAAITIAESEVNAQIAKIDAEAQLYSSQVHAKADREFGLAAAEAKRLKSDALTQTGGRYVVALETSKMFDNIEAAVMTPEQYVSFIRSAWALIGLTGSAPVPTGVAR